MTDMVRLPELRRVVIKVGSSTIAGNNGEVRLDFLEPFCAAVARLAANRVGVVVVTSGAIALGRPLLGLPAALPDIPTKQACAAIGQPVLMRCYSKALEVHGLKAAQVLITREDFLDRRRYLNAREAIHTLLTLGAVPVVNENDTVAVEEIQFGDNDNLSALVTGLLDADLLVLLTDVEGVYDADPCVNSEAQTILVIEEVTDELLGVAGEKAGALGRGGMRSKLLAARTTASFGIPTMIAKGDEATLDALLAGEPAGTFIPAGVNRLDSRKRWIAHSLLPAGAVLVDAGAARALVTSGRSLLPMGIVGVAGGFKRGDLVEIKAPDGSVVGRGLSRYGAEDVSRITGQRSDRIRVVLGYTFGEEVIHRDDMVIHLTGEANGP
ncbi:MAG: glutamate 5-kinase [Chloroflexota bacterium]